MSNTKLIIGIDEAGRGPLVGPVFAASVISQNKFIGEVFDSKNLTQGKREKLYNDIIKSNLFAVGEASIEEIEKYNILNATKLAIKRASDNLRLKYNLSNSLILIDGNMNFNSLNTISVIKGDRLFYSIAAASIIAKVSRDNLMKKLDEIHPEYGWASNKGYGTKNHIEAIKKFGITKYHRKSFLNKIINV